MRWERLTEPITLILLIELRVGTWFPCYSGAISLSQIVVTKHVLTTYYRQIYINMQGLYSYFRRDFWNLYRVPPNGTDQYTTIACSLIWNRSPNSESCPGLEAVTFRLRNKCVTTMPFRRLLSDSRWMAS